MPLLSFTKEMDSKLWRLKRAITRKSSRRMPMYCKKKSAKNHPKYRSWHFLLPMTWSCRIFSPRLILWFTKFLLLINSECRFNLNRTKKWIRAGAPGSASVIQMTTSQFLMLWGDTHLILNIIWNFLINYFFRIGFT